MKKDMLEIDEQREFVYYMREKYPFYMVHSDCLAGTQFEDRQLNCEKCNVNGGYRGWPDTFLPIIVPNPSGNIGSCGLFIEFKKVDEKLTREDGVWKKLHTYEQAIILDYLNKHGYTAVFAHGHKEAIEIAEAYFGHKDRAVLKNMILDIERSNELTKTLKPEFEIKRAKPYLFDGRWFWDGKDHSGYSAVLEKIKSDHHDEVGVANMPNLFD